MPNVKCLISRLLLAIGFLLAWVVPANAQASELRLSLHKDWGYSAGGQVQGLFTLLVRGPQDMVSVRFDLDGEEIATLTQPPFALQFNTDKYPTGWHKLSATARTSSERTLASNVINVEFVSAEQGWQVTQRIMIPLLVIIVGVILISTLGQFLLTGRGNAVLNRGRRATMESQVERSVPNANGLLRGT